MPSKSKKQHNLMALVANDPKAAKRLGIPQSVGRDFMKADKGHKFNSGGFMKYRMRPMARGEMEMPMRRRGGAPMTMRKGGKAESPEMVRKEIAFMKKKGAPKSMVRHEEEEMGGKMKKGVRKFDNGGPTRGGPQTRVPVGPTGPRYGYIPNPFGQDFRFQIGLNPTPRQHTLNRYNWAGELNPNYNQALAEYEAKRKGKTQSRYAEGGKVKKMQRGGPSSRESTGPISMRKGYFPNPFGKSIPFIKGPSGGGYQRSYPGSPFVMDENFRTIPNPDYDPRYDERGMVKPIAKGGKIQAPKKHRYAAGGSVHGSYRRQADGIASKGKTKGHMVKMRYGGKC